MTQGSATSASPQLKKELSAGQLFTLGFGTIIGVGWVTFLGIWLGQAGPAGALVGFVAGGVIMMLVGLCYAEMATMLPASGGEIAYTYEIFGLRPCFVVGWLLALVWVSVTTFEAISVGWVMSSLIPGIEGTTLYVVKGSPVQLGALLLGLGGMALLTALNYRGAKEAATFQQILTYTLLAFFVVFVAAGLIWGRASNLEPLFQSDDSASILEGIGLVIITAPFWYGGFNVIPQVMEEKSPGTPRSLAGRTIVWSILFAGIFYCLVIVSAAMAAPWQSLLELSLPAAGAFEAALDSVLMSKLVLIAALFGLITTWNAVFIAGSRVFFALGRARMIPAFFGTAHPVFGTPARAIVFIGVIGSLGVFFGKSAIVPIVELNAVCISVAYLLTCLGVIRLRRSRPDVERPFRVPGGVWTMKLAALSCIFVLGASFYKLYESTGGEWMYLLGWLVLGLLFWVATRKIRHTVTEEERRKLILGQAPSE